MVKLSRETELQLGDLKFQGNVVGKITSVFNHEGIVFIKKNVIANTNQLELNESIVEINPIKSKQLTNVRASGKDETIKLSPPRLMSLEQAIAYIQDDELVEVTPKSIRLRKIYLDSNKRKRMSRQG